MKHSPLPWEVGHNGANEPVITSQARDVCTLETYYEDSEANAAFIVRAVNSHDKLREALKDVLEWCDLIEQNYPEMRFTKAVRAALKESEAA